MRDEAVSHGEGPGAGRVPRRGWGFTLIELLIVVAIIGILAAIAIPALQGIQRRARYAKAMADTRIATTQSISYASDNNFYPTSLAALSSAGYPNVQDTDPWGRSYQLSPALTSGQPPAQSDDVYIWSLGPAGTGTYPSPFANGTGLNGSVGYSSVYGSWTGN